jgi:membrane-bound ClpP family serine protease
MEALLLWGLVLLGIAALIAVVDIFLPTGGVLALVSLTLAVAGVVCLFRYETLWGVAGTASVLVGGPALVALGFRVFPHTPLGRKLILGGDKADDEDREPPRADPLAQLVGSEATVVSDLRPSGVVRIGDTKFDALSVTTLTRAGARVKVVSVEGATLKVRPIE